MTNPHQPTTVVALEYRRRDPSDRPLIHPGKQALAVVGVTFSLAVVVFFIAIAVAAFQNRAGH
jgi:hypothetical protein